MNYIYEINGVLYSGFFADGNLPPTETYLIAHDLPHENIDVCVIDNGEIKIDQEKLIEFNRKNMPTLSPIEFDIKLNQNELYDVVQDLIKDNFELRITYTRAIFFSRTDQFIEQARIALKLTNEQVDEIWTS